ncbi:hypothetical protein [Aequorivita echinoideorum]|uniref:Peptidase family M48 n=1 Tax=Aequorivita echinoideorum TaxID=1549647 RepID=A0ABS5S355_9FLAO|nr:hypothetical protein [Aequorivita echinoideorum]MBT0607637.1 hypothetical protein [Aequorivita echinoideorum]
MEIIDWFKNQDYRIGVSLYAAHPSAKNRILRVLEQGKSDRNMATLIRELRMIKNECPAPEKPKTIPPPPKPAPRVENIGQQESERAHLKELAAKSYFQKIRYGELPPELKERFRKAKDLFYDMCDLKFQLNDLPDEKENEALSLMLQIEELDEQKDTIWKELEHWQLYKTKLPVKASEDFSKLEPLELDRKRRNLKSQISKKKKRISKWQAAAEKETDKIEHRKILQQINRTEKSLHQDEINLRKIQDLLN